MSLATCKKCYKGNNWFHGFCIMCWADVTSAEKDFILDRETANRLARKRKFYAKNT